MSSRPARPWATPFRGLGKVVTNFRFMALIFIVAGFWLIQGQLYGAMPTYIERVLGKGYKPEWLANINPLTVVLFVVPITHLVRKFRAGERHRNRPGDHPVHRAGDRGRALDRGSHRRAASTSADGEVHPVILLIIVGIALQGLAECFLSPKFLEYVSKQAPPGEVGLYLGYGHLHSFVAWFIAFIMAGLLLDSYCPDPRKQLDADTRHEWRLAVDDQYQCTLEGSPQTTEGESVTVPEWVRSALTAHDIKLPADAVLTELEPKDSWQTDPERRWEITTQTAGGCRARSTGPRTQAGGQRRHTRHRPLHDRGGEARVERRRRVRRPGARAARRAGPRRHRSSARGSPAFAR